MHCIAPPHPALGARDSAAKTSYQSSRTPSRHHTPICRRGAEIITTKLWLNSKQEHGQGWPELELNTTFTFAPKSASNP